MRRRDAGSSLPVVVSWPDFPGGFSPASSNARFGSGSFFVSG